MVEFLDISSGRTWITERESAFLNALLGPNKSNPFIASKAAVTIPIEEAFNSGWPVFALWPFYLI